MAKGGEPTGKEKGKDPGMAARKKMNRAMFQEWATGFGLLSDPTRLAALSILARGPKNVTALCNELGVRQPTASHHLKLLRMGRLVNGVRQGKSVVYETEKKALKELASALSKITPK